jgi:hypothetical protein
MFRFVCVALYVVGLSCLVLYLCVVLADMGHLTVNSSR